MAWSKNTTVDVNSYDREYRARNLEKRRAQQQAYEERLRQRIIDILGGACSRSDCESTDKLEIDHIEGDGKEDRAKANSRNGWLAILRRDCEGTQLLCWPHHLEKTLKERSSRK